MNNTIEKAIAVAEKYSFERVMGQMAKKAILLYGAGGFGVEMLRHLRRVGLSAAAVLDRRAAEICSLEGVPVYTAEEAPFDRATVWCCSAL